MRISFLSLLFAAIYLHSCAGAPARKELQSFIDGFQREVGVDGDTEGPPAKKAKTEDTRAAVQPATTTSDLEVLLAEKKRALLAALEAKTSGA